MKSGGEAHFVAGVLFTFGVAAMAVLPRMASDSTNLNGSFFHIGGKLSHPFRKALLYLVAIGMVRLGLHIVVLPFWNAPSSSFWGALDATLGIFHVVGQSFLCLSTAYLLQCQLSHVINLGRGNRPGADLVPYLVALAVLSLTGALGATLLSHPNWWSLINLAEAVSCIPVLQTLRLYTSVTVTQQQQQQQPFLRGPLLTQVLTVCEIWYLTTSLIGFVAEAMGTTEEDANEAEGSGRPLLLLLEAARHNQDNGVDDWTRLLLHSIFLNSIDELNHVQQQQQPPSSSQQQQQQTPASSSPTPNNGAQPQTTTVVEEMEETDLQAPLIRRRGDASLSAV